MTCGECQEWLLEDEFAADVNEHLGKCAACAALAEEVRRENDALAGLREDPAEAELSVVRRSVMTQLRHAQRQTWVWRGAVAAAVLVCAVLALWQGRPRTERVAYDPPVTLPARPPVEAVPSAAKPQEPKIHPPLIRQAKAKRRQAPAETGIRAIALEGREEGAPVIRFTTRDPNVVILWMTPEEEKTDASE